MKNMLDIMVGGIMYWVCGWALAHGSGGGSGFAGTGNFFAKDLPPDGLTPPDGHSQPEEILNSKMT